jgi:hypothetical protein
MWVNVDWWSASSGLRFPYCDAKWGPPPQHEVPLLRQKQTLVLCWCLQLAHFGDAKSCSIEITWCMVPLICTAACTPLMLEFANNLLVQWKRLSQQQETAVSCLAHGMLITCSDQEFCGGWPSQLSTITPIGLPPPPKWGWGFRLWMVVLSGGQWSTEWWKAIGQ